MLRTPVRLGGMGLRSVAETSIAAFVGGVEQAVTHFIGKGEYVSSSDQSWETCWVQHPGGEV